MLLAWELINDAMIQAKFKALAPEALPGTEEATSTWDQVTEGLDFDSSDGTPADSYSSKSLDMMGGGRTQFLQDKLEVGGETEADAANITRAHFLNLVDQGIPDTGQGFGARIEEFRQLYSK